MSTEQATPEAMLEKLRWNGSTGLDMSPGDEVAAWAYKRIVELESQREVWIEACLSARDELRLMKASPPPTSRLSDAMIKAILVDYFGIDAQSDEHLMKFARTISEAASPAAAPTSPDIMGARALWSMTCACECEGCKAVDEALIALLKGATVPAAAPPLDRLQRQFTPEEAKAYRAFIEEYFKPAAAEATKPNSWLQICTSDPYCRNCGHVFDVHIAVDSKGNRDVCPQPLAETGEGQ